MNYFKVIAVIFQTVFHPGVDEKKREFIAILYLKTNFNINTKNKLGMEGNVMFKNLYDFATRKEFG